MLIDPCELSPSYVRSIAPYQPGKPISELARELGLDQRSIIKLASNENPRGIGPRTRAAIDAALGDIARYPDGNGFELKQALSARYGVDMSAIVLGNGSNDVLVVVDEAYNEYLPRELRAESVKWLRRHPNLILTRTFSKAYGLAGLRVGYAFAHASVADIMNRVRQPFNVNSLALAAAAAALDDMEFVARSYAENLQGLRQLEEGAKRLGLDYIPSYGNFLTIRVGRAAEIYKRLLRRGVIVRPVGGAYQLPEHLRVTVGTPEENERFLAVLAASLRD